MPRDSSSTPVTILLVNYYEICCKGWISFGFHRDLDEAMFLPMEAMLDLMGELFGLDRHKALALASAAVDFRVTQVVNGARGVHALLPHGSIR